MSIRFNRPRPMQGGSSRRQGASTLNGWPALPWMHLTLGLVALALGTRLSAQPAPPALPVPPSEAPHLKALPRATLAKAELEPQLTDGIAEFFTLQRNYASPVPAALPVRIIHNLSMTPGAAIDAMELLLDQSGLALRVHQDVGRKLPADGEVVHLSGSAEQVLDQVARLAGSFVAFDEHGISLDPEGVFTIPLPPRLGDDSLGMVKRVMEGLGARHLTISPDRQQLRLMASSSTEQEIRRELLQLRRQQALLVYDAVLYQIDLPDGSASSKAWPALTLVKAPDPGGQRSARIADTATRSPTAALPKAGVLDARTAAHGALAGWLGQYGAVRVHPLGTVSMLTGRKETLQHVSIQADVQRDRTMTRLGVNLRGVVAQLQVNAGDVHGPWPEGLSVQSHTNALAGPGETMVLGDLLIKRPGSRPPSGLQRWLPGQKDALSELMIAVRPRVVRFPEWPDPAAARPGVQP